MQVVVIRPFSLKSHRIDGESDVMCEDFIGLTRGVAANRRLSNCRTRRTRRIRLGSHPGRLFRRSRLRRT